MTPGTTLTPAGCSPAVLDAMARLYVARARTLAGRSGRARLHGLADEDLWGWLNERVHGLRHELLAVTHWRSVMTPATRAPAHGLNLETLDRGIRMVSLFDHAHVTSGDSAAKLAALADSHEVPYLLGPGPIQIKVFDRAQVMFNAGTEDRTAVLVAEGEEIVAAAVNYVRAVHRTATPAHRLRERVESLTARQLDVATRLGRGAAAAEIAHELDTSLRTIRYDIARIRETLGVRSAFAAGAAYAATVSQA